MTILYLHGLNSTNVNARTKWLTQYGKLVNPLMDYKNYPEDYRYLEKLVIMHKPNVIVASSLGGYFGFHLGNYHHIPTILFNPAMLITNIVRPHNRQLVSLTSHFVSVGKKDDIIPPFTSKIVLEEQRAKYDLKHYDIGHETPFDVFVDRCLSSGLFSGV